MRDPDRIAPIMRALQRLWLQYPDYRFGQIIFLLRGKMPEFTDAFYTDDVYWLEAIQNCTLEEDKD